MDQPRSKRYASSSPWSASGPSKRNGPTESRGRAADGSPSSGTPRGQLLQRATAELFEAPDNISIIGCDAANGTCDPECHHVRMPRSRRSPNRITDDSLVDDAGYEWYRVNKDLRRDAIARLLGDPDVRVGVHAGRARLRWIADVERERVWSEEIEPNFHDHADDAIATSTPRQLPLHGTLWRRRGKQLLIFDDFD